MSVRKATVRFNVVTGMSSRQLEYELVAWLDANLPLLLRPAGAVSVAVYEDVLVQERAA